MHRLDQDGSSERLKVLADELLAEKRQSFLAKGTEVERLHAWLLLDDPELVGDPVLLADERNMCTGAEHPVELGEELFAHTDKVEPEVLDVLADALVVRALALEHPADAGTLLAHWMQFHPGWNLVDREIQAWRWAARPEMAFKALDKALTSGLNPEHAPAGAEDLLVRLALESGQPNLAFDVAQRRYLAAPAADQPALLRRLVELASLSDRTPQACALISAHLQHLPFHALPLAEAIALQHQGKAFANEAARAEYERYAAAMARWQEWDDHGSIAFETWLRLAILDHEEAWSRIPALQEQLFREDDFALVLADRIAAGKQLEREPALAAILLDQGLTEDAIVHYRNAARREADPSSIHTQLARIYQQSGEWEKAMESFGEVLKVDPNNAEAAKGRAFDLARLHRYEEACTAYIALARGLPEDAEVQETCATLCDSLGYAEKSLEASRRLLACKGHVSTVEDYMSLAEQCRFLGDSAGQVAVLRDGLTQAPQSSRLRITLAQALSDTNAHDEAVALLIDASLRDDPAALDLLISEAMQTASGSITAAEIFIAALPSCLDKAPEVKLRLAYLFDFVGLADESDRLVAELQGNSHYRLNHVWHNLAKVCMAFDDANHAESFELLHLGALGGKDSTSWELLGDIYTAEARTSEASIAYNKAIEFMAPTTIPAGLKLRHLTQAKVF
ncbi:MAG: hypothetical protein JWO08_26 [Verrucomicrobiaceae bacterium]|nr:hypothetical protein [Verrucomicrobiaceae bacterium]